jgi:hypothetical protein
MVLYSFVLVTFTPLANALGVFFRPHFLSGRLNVTGRQGLELAAPSNLYLFKQLKRILVLEVSSSGTVVS